MAALSYGEGFSGRDIDSYLAGLFDGEGSVVMSMGLDNTKRKRPRTQIHVTVSMCSHPPVLLLSERFGGHIYTGVISSGKTVWRWYVSGATAIPALEILSRLCVVKHQQALLALEVARSQREVSRQRRGPGRDVMSDELIARRWTIASEIKRLNSGWV